MDVPFGAAGAPRVPNGRHRAWGGAALFDGPASFPAGTQCRFDTSSSIARDAVLSASHSMSTRKFEQLSASSNVRTRFHVEMGGNVFSAISPLGGDCTSTHCPGCRGACTFGLAAGEQAIAATSGRRSHLPERAGVLIDGSVRVRERHPHLDPTLV